MNCSCYFSSFFSKQFSTYLCRPDHKQEFISQWQENYNGLDESLRHEEVVKAELHHRVDVSATTRCEGGKAMLRCVWCAWCVVCLVCGVPGVWCAWYVVCLVCGMPGVCGVPGVWYAGLDGQVVGHL